MHCFLVNANQECLIFDFSFSVESCLFMCLSVMRFFSLQFFPILTTVSDWYYQFDVFFFIHLFNSTGVVAVALVNLRWKDFVSLKLSQNVSFHKLLVLATECFFSFDNVEIHSDAFLGCFCVVDILWVLGSTMFFGFCLYVSEICHSMCLCLMRSFVVQFFFSFFRTLCG